MESPVKKSAVKVVDDTRRSHSPASITDEPETEKPFDIEAARKRFVGDIDLPESMLSPPVTLLHPLIPL